MMYRPTMSRNFADVGIALRNQCRGNPSVERESIVPLDLRSREEEIAGELTARDRLRAIFHVSDTRVSDCCRIAFVVSADR